MRKIILSLIILCIAAHSSSGQVIDMHMHSYTETDFWAGTARNGLESSKTARETLEQTIQKMDRHKIEYAVVCGSIESLERYTKRDDRFIPGYQDSGALIPVSQFEEYIKSGKIKVFGEIMAVYKGKTLADPIYQPYLALCEKYGIPVAYHSGGSFPNAQQLGWPDYRISLGDPFLIEDVLVKYPKLKIYLMHAGENFYENTLRMMDGYPTLHADLGVEMWLHPMTKDFAVKFLKSAQNYGFLDRVMFGSDQMVWPEAITNSIDFLNDLDFLTSEEKDMIFYKNARKFLEIGE
ncbi:amidohydrolase family protein [Christiangramia sabulilitoris]|uniref:Amidohydrolase n=1 Tax=Christiangramia sabulilitoris TaxID=2583991 RepID=A0A550I3G2_9FLAO|nr:amidohydrolase family protein [Christiangramia sabulilitoris]TRO65506.1 amidohydrolase [Christiangramia sabulilitoris]